MAKVKAAPKPVFKFGDKVRVNRFVPGSCPPRQDDSVWRVVGIDYDQDLCYCTTKFNSRDVFEFFPTSILLPPEATA